MKTFAFSVAVVVLMAFSILAQSTTTQTSTTKDVTATSKRAPVFRANKEQITQAQTILKQKSLYNGELTGKLDDSTREALRKYQEAENLTITGTLNRVTLEKMNIQLTDAQLAIPVSAPKAKASDNKDSKGVVFRATKDQIQQAQKILKDKGVYAGEQTGKMDEDFRTSLRKYQETEKIKVTGTLNKETLEKMGIALTDKQKAMPSIATK